MIRFGWPERLVAIAQTLIIGFSYMTFSDDFTQLSESLGFEMDFEEILGIVAITTFLVGFSSVRLQSMLEERKDGVARRIDRILVQNAGQDLLPLPTSLTQFDQPEESDFIDRTSLLTIGLTWLTFLISFLLIGVHQANSVNSSVPFWLVQGVHLGIVLIGSFSPSFVSWQFKQHLAEQPFHCYEKMMDEILEYLDSEGAATVKKETLQNFDFSVPEWCWLTLINSSLFPEDKHLFIPQLERLEDHAYLQKDADDYSLIAFVWSAYLLYGVTASQIVKFKDLERIMRFGSNPISTANDAQTFARLALREVKKVREGDLPEQNPNQTYTAVKKFLLDARRQRHIYFG